MQVVDLPRVEREQARLALFDNADLDAPDDREPLALVRRDRGRLAGHICREVFLAIARIRRQHDTAAPPPVAEHVRPRPDRMVHDATGVRIAIFLDDFARDRAHRRRRHLLDQRVVRLHEPDLQRVAIERLQAFDLRVVVELAARLRLRDGRIAADEDALDDQIPRRGELRIEQPLPAVHVVFRDQLARLVAEHGIGRKVDALPHLHDDRLAAIGDLGQAFRRRRGQRVRSLQEIVLQQRIEDRAIDPVRVRIRRRLRIEAGDVDGKRNADHLVRIGRTDRTGRCRERDERNPQQRTQHARDHDARRLFAPAAGRDSTSSSPSLRTSLRSQSRNAPTTSLSTSVRTTG